MTNATPLLASDVSSDYEKSFQFRCDPATLFDAITNVSALSVWWTPASGSAGQGDDIVFSFPDPLVVHVDVAENPCFVQWSVAACDFLPEWVGTRPTFTIVPRNNGGSELQFRHHGLTPELSSFDMCAGGWDEAIGNLRKFAEAN
jgi:uncharacterized protein YndB with AHSA1/START domain